MLLQEMDGRGGEGERERGREGERGRWKGKDISTTSFGGLAKLLSSVRLVLSRVLSAATAAAIAGSASSRSFFAACWYSEIHQLVRICGLNATQ